jgi:hypothetical protein
MIGTFGAAQFGGPLGQFGGPLHQTGATVLTRPVPAFSGVSRATAGSPLQGVARKT